MKGFFFTFEGIDGCGKSTQVRRISVYLQEKKIKHMVTREPGGTVISEKIREIILSPDNIIEDRCELLLYIASRAQHVDEKILEALDEGIVILCDRFQEATIGYQGYGRGIDIDTIKLLNNFATQGLMPLRTYLFDVRVEVAFERMKKANKNPDRLEKCSFEFFNKVREGLKEWATFYPDRICIINGEMSEDDIFEIVREDIIENLAGDV